MVLFPWKDVFMKLFIYREGNMFSFFPGSKINDADIVKANCVTLIFDIGLFCDLNVKYLPYFVKDTDFKPIVTFQRSQ